MCRWMLTSVVALSFLALSVTGSWALEVSYLDKNFERVKGKPLPQQVEFQSSAGQGKLTLLNGGQEGGNRVSAATITLNGTVIVEPNVMNQNIAGLNVDVPLEEQNVLVVELVSAPESFIDIAVTQEVQADAADFVGTEGKSIEVVDSSSPLIGTRLEIPQGALEIPVLISVAEVETPPEAPLRGTLAGQAVELEPNGLTFFDTPMILTLPYNDTNNDGFVDGTSIDERYVSVGFFNDETELWEQQKIISRDPQNNTVSAEITHFSIYSPFVRVDNIIPQTTQLPPVNIDIDGDPDEWTGVEINGNPILPIMSEPDDRYDSTCDPGSDIKYVYTAMDQTNAYIMVEMWDGPIKPDMTISLQLDIRAGKDLTVSNYGDLGMNIHGTDYWVPNLISTWNYSGDITFSHEPYANDGVEIARGNVLEVKIPLNLLRSDNTGDLPNWFNIVKVGSQISGYGSSCDEDLMYTTIDWFKFQKRSFGVPDDTNNRITFIFSQRSRAGEFLFEPDIDEVVVTRPDNSTITLHIDDLVAYPQHSAWGFYSSRFKTFVYDKYLNENYFIKNYYEGEDLQLGTYKFSLTNLSGDIYESDTTITRIEDLPEVDSSTVVCHIHQVGDGEENETFEILKQDDLFVISAGDLYCKWEYPDYIGNPDFEDVTEPIQVHPHLYAYLEEKMLRYVYPSLPYSGGEIINFVIIPAEDLSKLVDGADQLMISVRTRVKSDSVRSYSAKKDITELLNF